MRNKYRSLLCASTWLLLWSVALASGPLPQTFTATDVDLNTPANWTLVEVAARNASGDCSFSSSSVTSPQAGKIQANWAVDNVGSGRRGEVGLMLNTAVYDPSVSGAVGSVDFSIHHAYVTISPKARLLLRQGGKYYVTSPHFYETTQTSIGVVASDFKELDRSSTGTTSDLFIADSHPDFSADAAPMEFGIWAFQASSSQAGGSSTTAAFESSTFSVTVNPQDNRLSPFADYSRELPVAPPRPDPAPGAPNILIIMCDDLGYGDTSLTGHPVIKTPSIQALRDEGAFCSNYYSAANICSPSRASMLTGRMPYRLGIYSFIRDAEDYVHLDHTETTLPQVLQKVGYECANIGKWHVSHLDAITEEDLPTMRHYGFDYWLSSDNNLQIRNKNGWWRNETRVGTINGYAGTVVTDEIIDWLDNRRDQDRPFLLLANYYEPHADSRAPQDLIDSYTDLGYGAGAAQYYACVEHVDQQIGRMLAHFDAIPGLKDNTLVILTSDHGPNPTSTSRYGTAAPYRGTKYQCWDGSTHVPGIIRWPGKVDVNSTISEPVGSIDLLQTLAAITDSSQYLPKDRPLDGADISPLLTGQGEFSRVVPLQWHYYKSSASSLSSGSPQASMRLGNYVIAAWYDSPFSFGNVRWMPMVSSNNGIVEMDYITGTGTQAGKTLSSTQGTYRLYDISVDPHQDVDLYDPEEPAHVAMRDQLIASHQALRLAAPGWGFRTDAIDYSSYSAWRHSHWNAAEAADDIISGELADPDGDGYENLREYALAMNPRSLDGEKSRYVSRSQMFGVDGSVLAFLTFEFNSSRSSGAKLQGNDSSDLETWSNDESHYQLINRLRNTDGTYRVFYRLNKSQEENADSQKYLRLGISN